MPFWRLSCGTELYNLPACLVKSLEVSFGGMFGTRGKLFSFKNKNAQSIVKTTLFPLQEEHICKEETLMMCPSQESSGLSSHSLP